MKKVFIGVLAALMLFAFVACDSNTASGMVYSLEATQTAVYVKGETPVADGFEFTAYTNMGTTVSVDPADVVLVNKGGDTYGFEYLGVSVYGSVDVEFKAVTGITVDSSKAVKTYYASVDGAKYEEARKIDTTGLVISAEYEGGKKTIDTKDAEITSDISDWEAADDYTVTVEFQGFEKTYDVEIVPNLVESVAAKTTENYTLYYATTPAGNNPVYCADPTAKDAKGFYMEKTYQGGEVVVAESTTVHYQVPATGAFQAGFPSAYIPTDANGGSASIVIKYVGTDGTTALAGAAREGVISVTWTKKAPVSVEMTANPATMSKGGTFGSGNVSDFTFSVKSNDGTSADATNVSWWNGEGNTPTGNYIVLAEREALKDYTVGDRYKFTVTGSISDIAVNETFEATITQ